MTCEAHELLTEILDEIRSDTKEVKDAIIGTLDRPGIRSKQEDHERRIGDLEALKKNAQVAIWNVVKWSAGSAIAAVGGLYGLYKLFLLVIKGG